MALIQLVVKLGQSVLITSHTHSAVDNVCVRLQKYGVEILRLGSSKKVNPELQHRCESVLAKYCQTPEQLEEVYNSAVSSFLKFCWVKKKSMKKNFDNFIFNGN